ncbi:FN3 domain-containing metallophosphoesterase family protein [Planctomonas deserti]|uniref:FN3 domain-containing metallophosphoesterase family protein n=1 Tax=Planctomonas deserti TaxID=2144185 RepID=UPI00131EF29B|nr:FN3 domain-containing metallophosphoesterase family protein [Planctomonas deserti]
MSVAPVRHRRRIVAASMMSAIVATPFAVITIPAVASAADGSLVSSETVWRYSADGSDPARGADDRLVWTTEDYDDSAWRSAPGAFGAKNGSATPNLGAAFPVETVLPLWLDEDAATRVDVPTYHFRTEVSLSEAELADIDALTGSVTYDDAVQIFVNGTKVAGLDDARVESAAEDRRNVTYAGSSGDAPETSTFEVPASVLVAGTNTVAVALYQNRASSSDVYLDLASLVPAGAESGEGASSTITDLVLGVGADESKRTLNWYSDTDSAQVAQFAPASAMTGDRFPTSVTTVQARGARTTSGEFSRKATLQGLRENTEYVYRVGGGDSWSAVQRFRTRSFEGDFTFLFVGDPQIGGSGDRKRDEAGWIDTLNVAQAANPTTEMIFSAGDQVEEAANESHYDSFLAPRQLRSVPLVVTNGNHDVGSKAYEQHFNVPDNDPAAGAASSGSSSGGDYWFLYKDVLFVNLNSNSRDYAAHNSFMQRVVAEQGPKARWKVLAFHHSIYSVAAHTTASDILDRRENMPAMISELGFDLVLQGHDHSYTRSFLVKDGRLADGSEKKGQREVVADPGEVLYVTANSSSGSKYYSVQTPSAWFASVVNQERVRNYSVVDVTDDAITVKTVRSQRAGDSTPVNSVVDEVTLRQR